MSQVKGKRAPVVSRSPSVSGEQGGRKTSGLSTRGLVLVGVGGIIGAGFFLGAGEPIRTAGPAVLIAFLFGALITAQVTGALTSIAVVHPVRGSYQVFPQMYIGRFAGYLQGWTYYLTSVLTISSEAVAMAVFTKVWFPHLPTLLTAGVYSAVIILINAFGVKGFERIESLMSVLKIGALIGFVVYGAILILTALGHGPSGTHSMGVASAHGHGFFPTGFSGVLQSMLLVIFSYAGIGVFASAAPDLKDTKEIDSAAIWTIVLLTVLYLASISVVLWLVPWYSVSTSASPFVVAIASSGAKIFAMIINGVILVAAFSVMAGSLYSANQVLTSLGQGGDAPKFVSRLSRRGTPWMALVASTIGIAAALVLSTVLSANVYNFLISASSFFTFLNWFLILWTFLSWRKRTGENRTFTSKLAFGQPVSTVVTMILLVGLAAYALLQRDQRYGFYSALALWAVLCVVYWFRRRLLARSVSD